jgi:hypothetical protein
MMRDMKHCLASIPLLLAFACTPSAELTDKPSTTADQPEPPSTTAEQPSAEAQHIQLSQDDKKLEVETGTELRYSFKSHASVGIGAKFEVGNPNVLEHVRTDMEYAQSEEQRADKDGADAATGTFVFTAKSPGTTTLRVTEHLRGDPQRELKYAITVVDP